MIERGENFRFALEPRHALGISRERFGQNFQRRTSRPSFRIARAVQPRPSRPRRWRTEFS